MADFKPSAPFSVPMMLYVPIYETVNGVRTKKYDDASGIRFNGSFQTFGGTETTTNGLYVIKDTATIITWYMPELGAECRIKLLDDGSLYEIIGTPENINRRNQYSKFKVERVSGGA